MTIVWSSTSYGSGLSGSFTTDGESVTLIFAGSAWATDTGTMQVNLLINGSPVLTLNGCTNEIESHKALVPAVTNLALKAGTYTATISFASPTVVDLNDYFTLVVI